MHRTTLPTARTPRSPLLSAASVVLATVGCAPPGPQAGEAETASLRLSVPATPDLTLSVLRAGTAGAPRLVLVHGTPGSASAWADYLVNPPPRTEVLALDRPGFGQSAPTGPVTALEAQAHAVAALLPADGRRTVLVGHSLGGAVVARVAAEHPDRVSALLLLAASLDPALEVIHPLQRVGAWPPVRGLLPRALRNANAELMALEPELRALAALLPRIRAEVHIVHGSDDDLVAVANVGYLQRQLTAARCVRVTVLEGHNHFLPWNAEGAVRAAMQRALEGTC